MIFCPRPKPCAPGCFPGLRGGGAAWVIADVASVSDEASERDGVSISSAWQSLPSACLSACIALSKASISFNDWESSSASSYYDALSQGASLLGGMELFLEF